MPLFVKSNPLILELFFLKIFWRMSVFYTSIYIFVFEYEEEKRLIPYSMDEWGRLQREKKVEV